MKASQVRVKALTGASMAALETAVNDFLATLDEQTFIGLQYQVSGTDFTALLIFTE